jgi:hypothetical protein
MVELIEVIETKHQEYIDWLRSQKSNFNIDDFIAYVADKKGNYRLYAHSRDASYIDELPRSINRYLDEYIVDYKFVSQSNTFTNELSLLIGELIDGEH